MKFKDVTGDQISSAREIYNNKELSWDTRMQELMILFGKSERTIRRWISNPNKLGFVAKTEIDPEILKIAKLKKHDKTKKRFLITSAQNATPIHKGFFKNLIAYAEHINAEILVIPYRYHNPTSIWSDKDKKDDWWVNEIKPFLTLNRHKLNDNLSVLGHVKIQPTANMPLNGLEGMTDGESGIIGHPRVHMKSLPVLDSNNPRFMFTTGSCSVKNYIESKAGLIADFNHIFGACIVEIKNNTEFFVRQITADDKSGNFIDLCYDISNGIVTKVVSAEAIILGDIHLGNHNEKVLNSSFNKLIPALGIKTVVCHDIFDGHSINHHEANNLVKQYQNEVNGVNSLKEEINTMLEWLREKTNYNLVVVFSNHDDFLNRFIMNSDVRKNVKNALEYMEYGKILLEDKAPNGLIPYIINQRYKNIKCLGRNESFKLKGWELGIHGNDGVNGSRGGISQYKRLNSKVITAHAHSPVRMDGALQVGTNTNLRMGYNNGISTWVHSDVIIHKNSKAQHIIYNSLGEFTTFDI